MNEAGDHIAIRLLRKFCPRHLAEAIEGDLMERYERDMRQYGARVAGRRLWWNVLRFVRPEIILRNKRSIDFHGIDLLKSNFKFAIRAFWKDKFFSGLNIVGLAIGISVSLVLLLILQSDFTYDQHYANHQRIYRLGVHYQSSGTDEFGGGTARELAPILVETYPEIEAIVRIRKLNQQLVRRGATVFYEENVVQTDSTYFQIFTHKFIAGDPASCLSDPNSVVITETAARKYFDLNNPIGEILSINKKERMVTGIIKDLPDNTHVKFEFLLAGLPEIRPDWDFTMKDGGPISLVFWNPDVYTYLLLPEGYDPERLYSRFPAIYNRYYKEVGDQSGGKCTAVLQQLSKIHFSGFGDDWPPGNFAHLIALTGIGLMVVFMVCINYMNLATAKAVNRAKEVGLKKIVGARRTGLALSFLCESLLLSTISFVLAVVMVTLVFQTTGFSKLIDKNLHLDFVGNSLLAWGSLGIVVVVAVISGIYPAFYLPSIPTVPALKGNFRNSAASHWLRKGLITVQFSISIFVVACTIYMSKQIDFVHKKDLGFDSNNVLVVPIRDKEVRKRLTSIKNELLRDRRIISAAGSASVMGMGIGGNVMFGESSAGMQQQSGILGHFVGDDYLKTLGIQLIRGRNFKAGDGIDEDGVYIANEAAVKLMGWGDEPLGKKVTFWGGENPGVVIGVVKDFNASSLRNDQEPMFLVKGHWESGYLQIRLTGEDLPGIIAFVKQVWKQHDAANPFEYFFLDQRFNEQYKADVTQNRLLSVLAFLSAFIAILGIVGLAAFTATQRSKEIGVRKVMGARFPDIILLLSKSTLMIVLTSSMAVLPLCYWVISTWLDGFAYRIEPNIGIYAMTSAAAVVLVLLTILIQSTSAALRNPAETLKYE